MDIAITKSPTAGTRRRPADSDLGFGQVLTDHMFLMDYSADRGWHSPRIEPYRDLGLDPVAIVLHYNQQVFEGLKAYSLADGGIGLFRPHKNIERMNLSARRMVMPQLDAEVFLSAVKELVLLDRYWMPTSEGTAIYIRPTMIATQAALGVQPSETFLFFIVLSPVGPYYREGFNPTRIFVSDDYTRAAQGGVGNAKTSGNYGPTLYVSEDAKKKGYTQVLWLDAEERRYVEEVGTSNIFFVIEGELVTPSLSGSILAGVTRDSVIQVARSWGIPVRERRISMAEVAEGCRSGAISEAFATGTAAVVSPIGEIGYMDDDIPVGEGGTGPLAQRLYDEIVGIQYGHRDDHFGWRVQIA